MQRCLRSPAGDPGGSFADTGQARRLFPHEDVHVCKEPGDRATGRRERGGRVTSVAADGSTQPARRPAVSHPSPLAWSSGRPGSPDSCFRVNIVPGTLEEQLLSPPVWEGRLALAWPLPPHVSSGALARGGAGGPPEPWGSWKKKLVVLWTRRLAFQGRPRLGVVAGGTSAPRGHWWIGVLAPWPGGGSSTWLPH